MNLLKKTIALPRGFRGAGIHAGIKKDGEKDMALIVSDTDAAVAGVFTTNPVHAAPVKVCRRHLPGGRARAIVVNSGIANACTGRGGLADARAMAAAVARRLKCPVESVFVSSTGIIGKRLPMSIVRAGIDTLLARLSPAGGRAVSEAILTTDTRPKRCLVRLRIDGRPVLVAGMAKGAGMIEPNMATMLSYLLTDAAVQPAALQRGLQQAVDASFNRISVDGDRSTNDSVLLLANGAAGTRPLKPGHPDWPKFLAALRAATEYLAREIVYDGEGATRFVTVQVRGARSDTDADRAARAVANSLLVKTSWAGTYPNWGRILDAVGYSGARVVEDRLSLHYNDVPAVRRGIAAPTPIRRLQKITAGREFNVAIDLHLGRGQATVYTCNCTEEYVRINV
jgi:glutamate N-acetyltransferase/amino-acid N-acetyltransferase